MVTMPKKILYIREILTESLPATATLTLTFELRRKNNLRTKLDSGSDVLLALPHGHVLHNDEVLRSEDGIIVRVIAAKEKVSTAYTRDTFTLTRTCYHLGVRHVPIQIGIDWVRYKYNPIVDDMVKAMGLEVREEEAPFDPESILQI